MLVHLVDSLDLGIKGQGQFKAEEQLKALSACLKVSLYVVNILEICKTLKPLI